MRRSILTTVLFIALLLQGCGEQQNKTIKTLIDDISLRKIGTATGV
jgi:PBP1b-binding outer membrane lipoprotein LpoB